MGEPEELRCWRCKGVMDGLGRCQWCSAYNLSQERPQPDADQHGSLRHGCWRCGRFLFASVGLVAGRIQLPCKRCKAPNVITAEAPGSIKVRRSAVYGPGIDEIVTLMEERWRAYTKQAARRRAEVASGLRFDVFLRDAFRCRYCGVGADDGAILHVDHVVPRSAGGETCIDNLVTACLDCNLGKSNKRLELVAPL
jgi:hypothetical protein